MAFNLANLPPQLLQQLQARLGNQNNDLTTGLSEENINNLVNSKKDDIVKLTGRTIIKDNVEKRYSFDKAEGFLLNEVKKEL